MNNISWMIYLADVASDTNAICGFVFYLGCIGVAIYSLGKGVARIANYGFEDPPVTPSISKIGKGLAPYVIAAAVVGVLVPSKESIYAIAASEVGERVIKSETGGKAVEALNAWLDAQINKSAQNKEQS